MGTVKEGALIFRKKRPFFGRSKVGLCPSLLEQFLALNREFTFVEKVCFNLAWQTR